MINNQSLTPTPSPSHDIWHVNYNKTVAEQQEKGWTGIFLVLALNMIIFLVALGIFSFSRSGHKSLYCFGKNPPKLHGTTFYKKLKNFIQAYSNVEDLHNVIGDEGTFYLLFQINAIRMLFAMGVLSILFLIPTYTIIGRKSTNYFEMMTIRMIPTESPILWIPVASCWINTFIFFFFIRHISFLCTNKDPSRTNLLCMRPSSLSARSLFINRGIPKYMNEDRMFSLLEDIFPGYVSHVAVVLDLTEYKSMRSKRMSKENQLERNLIASELRRNGSIPCPLILWFGISRMFTCCFKNSEENARRILQNEIDKSKREEVNELKETVRENRGAGRAFIVFNNSRCKANFARRIRHKSIKKTLEKCDKRAQGKVSRAFKELMIHKWDVHSAPEPDDIDWDSVSYPFVKRTVCMMFINFMIFIVLLVFTSPVAVTATFTSGMYSGAANVLSQIVNGIGNWISGLSPAIADMIFAYVPTLILVIINWLLLNVLYYAGRLQPIYTDSGKEQKILRSSAVYLIFNTLFVPSFAFASIDALVIYLKERGQVLDILGEMFLHNSGIFFVNYVIQRALIGTAMVLLRIGEIFEFMWYKSIALTDKEHESAVEAWQFYSGTQSALQISVVAVIVSFSTVVPVIVPFGVFYMIMQHLVDKYSLLYIRPKIPGRGTISKTATHGSVFCILIYQAGMTGFFIARGTQAQSSAVIVLLMITYILVLWWYINDKQVAYEDTAQAADETIMLLSSRNPVELYREPSLRDLRQESGILHADRYGSMLLE